MPQPDDLSAHYGAVVRDLVGNRVVPLLGAGVNLCERPPGAGWTKGANLPSRGELADHLATQFFFPGGAGMAELVRRSQS